MGAISSKLISMVAELDEILVAGGINYCVSNELAWNCWTGNVPSASTLEPAVLVNCESLNDIAKLATPNNRLFVADEDSSGHLSLRYVASDTTFLDAGSVCWKAPGLAIRIDAIWPTEAGQAVYLRSAGMVTLPDNPLPSVKRGYYEGISMVLPNDPDSYLEAICGANWRKRYSQPRRTFRYGMLLSAKVPFSDYLETLYNEFGFDVSDAESAAREYRNWCTTSIRETEALVANNTESLRLVMHRFKLCEKLLPLKSYLLESWDKGEYDLVDKTLSDYANLLISYYESGRILHFDNDLFDLVMKVLRRRGWRSVDDAAAMVPKRYSEFPVSKQIMPYILVD